MSFESMQLEDMRIFAEMAKRHPEEWNAGDVERLATMTLALLSTVYREYGFDWPGKVDGIVAHFPVKQSD